VKGRCPTRVVSMLQQCRIRAAVVYCAI
jgi:hypothetical protein